MVLHFKVYSTNYNKSNIDLLVFALLLSWLGLLNHDLFKCNRTGQSSRSCKMNLDGPLGIFSPILTTYPVYSESESEYTGYAGYISCSKYHNNFFFSN